MARTQAYHKSAIIYNERLAEAAEALVPELEDEEVKKWCTSVGKQHRFHAKRHRMALNKLLLKEQAPPVEQIMDGLDVPEPKETDVNEVADILEPQQPEVDGNPALTDGCSPHHNPTLPTCEFNPTNKVEEVSNG
jgi:hypothetical protein